MHLLKNEQGGPIPHGHHHDHAHEHHHKDLPANTPEQMTAVLNYMLQHNQAHAAELLSITEKLSQMGNDNAAELVKKAADAFSEGNRLLGLALEQVKEA